MLRHDNRGLQREPPTVSEQELEANEFAGELLMPTEVLAGMLRDQKPSFELIESLAREFSTSLTATACRFVEMRPHAYAVVWSEGFAALGTNPA